MIQRDLNRDAFACVAVNAEQSFFDRFKFSGENLLAVACSLPEQPITVSGNSFAWPIHRVVITDSLDADSCQVLADWITPRPMNTRLGPDHGITIHTTEAYILIGNKFADHWVANRILLDNEWPGDQANGYRVLSSSETEINDFHDAVVYFEWS